ncbi:regulation of nuclear pre-mRNA domain-containing protein 1A-like [Xenia sp. Carnegie-2017]|uniref:regulation of nuclear pre-mRNA domain-containing protein 1A-like n=1 Tax=Xenia sp. Carnegie-2017 TaxID=2897299 RepID=UPI001F047AD4|nr:regulation of nuclear pre-mRNA domain-containing protein 1A-like [Xenia sp. Carnegie-2017]
MASFSVKSFDKKLKEMSARQDSVQTVSLWLIHHRAHSKTVVNVWLDRMKKAKPDRRLVLFYLANDVIQNSRKKGKEFSASFGKVLGESMQYLRDTSIQPSVERVLKIWLERKVFEKDAVQKLLDQLKHVTVKMKPRSKSKSDGIALLVKENEKIGKVKERRNPNIPFLQISRFENMHIPTYVVQKVM